MFTTAVAPGNVFAFINFLGFQLAEPEMQPVTDLFGKQMLLFARLYKAA